MRVRQYSKMEGGSSNTINPIEEEEEPYEGMELESEDAAISFYMNYAGRIGFRTRMSRYVRSIYDNSIISRQIICAKAGFDPNEAKRGTKVGCKAMIEVKRTDNRKWVVSKFDKEHNHALSPPPPPPRICSKKAKHESESGICSKKAKHESESESERERAALYDKLYKEAVKYAEEGCVTEDIYEIAIAALREASEKVCAAKREMNKYSSSSCSSTEEDEDEDEDEASVPSTFLPATASSGGARKESGVHATAIACGARVIPAEQAASLFKYIQAKITSGHAIIATSNPPSSPHITTLISTSSHQTPQHP